MLNNVVLVGRLTKDAELRYTQSNVAVATFTLAVNRTFKSENGEREADFINCVIWRQSAENLANWAKKGSLIGITGGIQTRSYDNQQGQKVYVTEVLAENFSLLESRNVTEQRPANDQSSHGGFQQNQTNNFNQFNTPTSSFGGGASDPFLSNGETINISDDDLPF